MILAGALIALVHFIKLGVEKRKMMASVLSHRIYIMTMLSRDHRPKPERFVRLHFILQVRVHNEWVHRFCLLTPSVLHVYICTGPQLIRYMNRLLDSYSVEAQSMSKENEHTKPHDNKPPCPSWTWSFQDQVARVAVAGMGRSAKRAKEAALSYSNQPMEQTGT